MALEKMQSFNLVVMSENFLVKRLDTFKTLNAIKMGYPVAFV